MEGEGGSGEAGGYLKIGWGESRWKRVVRFKLGSKRK